MTTVIRNRLAFESDFVLVPNAWMRDKRLSRRARGLLAELMSHRDGYSITTIQLVNNGTEGRDAIRATLSELRRTGYLTRTLHRSGAGKFTEQTYELSDPFAGDAFPVAGQIVAGNPGPFKKTISKKTNFSENANPKEHSANARGRRDSAPGPATLRQRQYLADISSTLEHLGEDELSTQMVLRALDLSRADADALIKEWWTQLEHARFTGELVADASLPTRINDWLDGNSDRRFQHG